MKKIDDAIEFVFVLVALAWFLATSAFIGWQILSVL